MQQFDPGVNRIRSQLLLIQEITPRTGKRLCVYCMVNIDPDEGCGLVRKTMVEPEHTGIFVDDLSAFAVKRVDIGTARLNQPFVRISVEDGNQNWRLRCHLRTKRIAGNAAGEREAPMLPVSFVGKKEKSLARRDRAAERSPKLVQTKRLLRATNRNRLQGIEGVIAKEFKNVSVKCIGAGG